MTALILQSIARFYCPSRGRLALAAGTDNSYGDESVDPLTPY
ncbi:hypothetical protein [Mesorhizobium sp. M0016]